MGIKDFKPIKGGTYSQGYVNPDSCKKIFPQMKTDKIIYRSSYERKFIAWMENSEQVRYWGSECIRIPYTYVVDGKTHSYYPDYFVEMMDGTCMVVEIKPSSQTKRPVNENTWVGKEYIKNMCKWKATMEFCEKKGYKFKIITEKTINML